MGEQTPLCRAYTGLDPITAAAAAAAAATTTSTTTIHV